MSPTRKCVKQTKIAPNHSDTYIKLERLSWLAKLIIFTHVFTSNKKIRNIENILKTTSDCPKNMTFLKKYKIYVAQGIISLTNLFYYSVLRPF